MNIGHKIKQKRINAGMTQEQLSLKLGVSAQSVSKWETGITMPDIALLPDISEAFGISIDELFDLTNEQKLKRIESKIELEEEFSPEMFREYEDFLREQLVTDNRLQAVSLLANLYHRRMESDSKAVAKYAKEAILLDPSKKDCQWLLAKAEGHVVWDWNMANHSKAIDFYKEVIESDKIIPKTSLPYYYLIDNLIADNRIAEAEYYLNQLSRLPSASKVLLDVYPAYFALSYHMVDDADRIIQLCVENNPESGAYLFEAEQYYARRCDYDKAIEFYERSWNAEKSPRFTDALYGIATIYHIQKDKEREVETFDRILKCLKNEWGYSNEDKPYIETLREKMHIINK